MISTNEKELAIQIWESIKEELENDPQADIDVLKAIFCREHGIIWKCNCILCENYMFIDGNKCSMQCPIMRKTVEAYPDKYIRMGCTNKVKTDYAIVENADMSLAQRQEAIDNIIQAIKEA
jgi:hypothetical protein